MGLVVNLTPAQLTRIEELEPKLRGLMGWLGRMSSVIDVLDDAVMVQSDGESIEGIVTSLDAGEVIPRAGGLAGSQPLTRESWLAMLTYMRFVDAEMDKPAVRTNLMLAAGPDNILDNSGSI